MLKAGNAKVEIGTLNSAVNLEDLSGDVAGCRGGEKDDHRRDLPWVAHPAQWGRLLHLPAPPVVGGHYVQGGGRGGAMSTATIIERI